MVTYLKSSVVSRQRGILKGHKETTANLSHSAFSHIVKARPKCSERPYIPKAAFANVLLNFKA